MSRIGHALQVIEEYQTPAGEIRRREISTTPCPRCAGLGYNGAWCNAAGVYEPIVCSICNGAGEFQSALAAEP